VEVGLNLKATGREAEHYSTAARKNKKERHY
jgi:hypothetical protein